LKLSLIIPAHNEAALIERTVLAAGDAAAGVVGSNFEIVVVDDASTDDTGAIAASAGARVVRVEHRHIAATRNSGAKASLGQVFLFVDADTLINREVVAAAFRAIERGAVGCGASVRFDVDTGVMGTLVLGLWNGFSRITRWASGCFICVRRDAFEAVGGFDERFFAGEEIYLSRALKTRGRFLVLRQTVETSGRKMRMHSPAKWVPMAMKLALLGPRAWQSRERLWLWYDGKREEKAR